MSTFLGSHLKIHQLQSRLKKNPYLSNDCLPNFLDALVIKALKVSKQIPKRDIYPCFYHWYILMLQFADRTLDHWLKNYQAANHADETVLEVVQVVTQRKAIKTQLLFDQINQYEEISQPEKFNLIRSLELETKSKNQFFCVRGDPPLMKKTSLTDKFFQTLEDPLSDYLMSIILSSDSQQQFKEVRGIFQHLKVKMQSIKRSDEEREQQQSSCVRIYFEATQKVCQQLKNCILRFSYVNSIQCKKQRRNHIL